MKLDACKMRGKKAAHTYLSRMLSFPAYYGRNLDALYDCLTELPATKIQFINRDKAPDYFQKVYKVFADAAAENKNLTLE